MPRVIVQPARNAESAKNYAKTVEQPISLSMTNKHLDAQDQSELTRLHPSGGVPVWGTTGGEKGQMETKWNRISTGDVVLFTGRNEVFKVATVTHKFRSATLADELWEKKVTANNHTASWEFMYAFNQPVDVRISYDRIIQALDGLPFPTREFSVLNEDQSNRILSYLESASSTPPPLPSSAATRRVVREFDEMESEYLAKRRLEQSYLRQYLLSGAESQCWLCGRTFSAEFLVAAHIKKRSQCTPDEKADIPAIAMLACKFGCDELYERGMVVVGQHGKIAAVKRLTDPSARAYVEGHLKGRSIANWGDRAPSHRYFSDHKEFWTKGKPSIGARAGAGSHP